MSNEELAKELLGYTYTDIQRVPDLYMQLGVDVNEFKLLYDAGKYEQALDALMSNLSAKILFKFLMNPLNRLKSKLS